MLPVLPMFIPQVPSIDRGEDEAGGNDVDRESSPEVYKHKFVLVQLCSKCLVAQSSCLAYERCYVADAPEVAAA